MKKTLILSGLTVILLGGIFATGYFWWRPRVANEYVVQAADAFLAGQDNNDMTQFQRALELVNKAMLWGKTDSTTKLFRGHTLAKLGRTDEARDQYEAVQASDPSAKAAVEDLLNQL